MKVLVACEESQAVCMAFRAKGHEAFSCDVQECSGGFSEYHVCGDVLPLINGNCTFITMNGKKHTIYNTWDLLIAHPPCTYLSNAGSSSLRPYRDIDMYRYKKGLAAKEFFMKFLNADCLRIAVENPVPIGIYKLPKYSQIIQPYEFGHPFQKRTCLWLKGLPYLEPTDILPKNQREPTTIAKWYNCGGKDRQKNRSKTFHGIAKAMAEQWGKENLPLQLTIFDANK